MNDLNAQGTPISPEASAPALEHEESKDARTWGMLCHLSALAGFVIPFGNVLAPLVLWLIKKKEYAFVDDQGKEALNFQITVTIAMVICIVLIFVCVGAILAPIIGIAALVFTIIAAIKANDGNRYRYPLTIRLIK